VITRSDGVWPDVVPAWRDCRQRNVDQISELLGPAYGEVSPDGIDHFKVVATKIGGMAAVEPDLQASELAK
jgi:hypothetical protein